MKKENLPSGRIMLREGDRMIGEDFGFLYCNFMTMSWMLSKHVTVDLKDFSVGGVRLLVGCRGH